jgi:hypothetical protein
VAVTHDFTTNLIAAFVRGRARRPYGYSPITTSSGPPPVTDCPPRTATPAPGTGC